MQGVHGRSLGRSSSNPIVLRCNLGTFIHLTRRGLVDKMFDSTKLEGCEFKSHTRHDCFKISQFLFTPYCLCLSDETLKAIGRLHLVSMPGEVKDTRKQICNLSWTSLLQEFICQNNSYDELTFLFTYQH